MEALAQLDLDESFERVQRLLQSRRRALVTGPVGSGRTLLAQRLVDDCGSSALSVEAPSINETDAGIYALAAAAAHGGSECVRLAVDDATPLTDRALRVGKRLDDDGRTLFLRLPASWVLAGRFEAPDEVARRRRALDVLAGFVASGVRLVVLTAAPSADDWGASAFSSVAVTLPKAASNLDGLLDATRWGAYAEHAKALREHLANAKSRLKLTPLQLRLAVGLVALGHPPVLVTRELAEAQRSQGASTLNSLVDRLAQLLNQAKHAPLRAGVSRVLEARFSLPAQVVLELAAIPEQHAPLVTQSIGYGEGDRVRFAEPVRGALRRLRTERRAADESHYLLAKHYALMDGARSPLDTQGESTRAWFEKAHHLAHVSPAHVSKDKVPLRWDALELPARELYWDRGRALSVELRDYEAAAKVFRACVEKFEDDSYGWHYLGWNLDKAGEGSNKVRVAYEQAVNLERDNPWWNSRLVTFLISRSQFEDAREGWAEAQDRIDPDRLRIRSSPWLARHVHRWVVNAWLDAGEVEQARAALDLIPVEVVADDEKLQTVKWRLEDAEEARALVESVYPPGVRPADRWKSPQIDARHSAKGKALRKWFPGRITEASAQLVEFVVADPSAPLPSRRVIAASVTATEWTRRGGWCAPAEASGYVELHVFEDGSERINPVRADSAPWAADADDEFPAFLAEWPRD